MNPELCKLHIKILEDSNLSFEQKKEMLNEIRKIIPPSQNRWNFRYAIIPLVITVLTVPAYAFVAMYYQKSSEIPDALLSLASTALGAIAAFLTNQKENQVTSSQNDDAPVDQKDNAPVSQKDNAPV